MADLNVQGVVHWSIPVNDLEESENFYGELLGLEAKGRLGNSRMSCFKAGEHYILLCARKEPLVRTPQQDNRLHHAFRVTPEMFQRGCKVFHQKGVRIAEPIVYREKGHFTGRELYFLDPSGNMLELCDPTWKSGMPTPTYEEIVEKQE
jgi:catechol 2,3-dioxygenase-like lactoylglutathione lyase family enzyme